MRNLDLKIVEWRSRMAAGGLKSPAVLDELESHLREEIAAQLRSGADEIKAFEIAAQKIGGGELLKAEFAKVGEGKTGRSGMVLGIACGLAALPFSIVAVPNFLTIPELPAFERGLSLMAILLTFLSVASWRFSHRFLPVIRNRRVRLAISVSCGLVGLVWLYAFAALLPTIIVPNLFSGSAEMNIHPAFTMGTAILWAMALTAGLGAVAYGLEDAARRRANETSYV